MIVVVMVEKEEEDDVRLSFLILSNQISERELCRERKKKRD
jgi:hypothetical protein